MRRAELAKMPAIARRAGRMVHAHAGSGLEMRTLGGREVSEKLDAHTLRISTQYLAGYVEKLALEDPATARDVIDNVREKA